MHRFYARRRWVYAALVAVLALDAGIYFGWVENPEMVAEADPQQVATLEAEVERLQANVDLLEGNQARAPQLEPEMNRFVAEWFLPEKSSSSQLYADLNEAARAAGVVLGQVQSSPERDQANRSDLVPWEITATVQGRYVNLLHYLQRLEKTPRMYLISSLSVAAAQGNQLRVNMRLSTYVRRGAS